jgi:hypothetical protein
MGLAERGVLRSLRETPEAPGRALFQFVWLHARPMELRCDARRDSLILRALLPGVEPRSEIDRDVRAYVRGRIESKLPAHRRLDPARVEARCVRKGGALEIALRVRRNHYHYATTKALNLAQEIFAMLGVHHVEYMVERFGMSDE